MKRDRERDIGGAKELYGKGEETGRKKENEKTGIEGEEW